MENIKFIYEKIKTFFITIINPPEAGNKKNINESKKYIYIDNLNYFRIIKRLKSKIVQKGYLSEQSLVL